MSITLFLLNIRKAKNSWLWWSGSMEGTFDLVVENVPCTMDAIWQSVETWLLSRQTIGDILQTKLILFKKFLFVYFATCQSSLKEQPKPYKLWRHIFRNMHNLNPNTWLFWYSTQGVKEKSWSKEHVITSSWKLIATCCFQSCVIFVHGVPTISFYVIW